MAEIEMEFEHLGLEEKEILLEILGYYVDENGIIFDKNTGEEHVCPVTNDVVFIENASVLPGSTVIINTTELSLSEYFLEHVENSCN